MVHSRLISAIRLHWRRYGAIAWLALFSVLLPFFIYRSRGDIAKAGPALSNAHLPWVAAAFGMQLVMLALVASKYNVLLTKLGVAMPRGRLARFHLRRHLVSTLIPFGGPAGLMHFVRDMGRHRVPMSTSVYSSFLGSVVNEIAFALFMIPVLTWLALAGRATTGMIVSTSLLLAVLLGGFALALTLLRKPALREKVDLRLPAKFADGLAAASAHGIRPRDLLPAVPFSLGVNVCSVAMLTFSLWAVGAHPSLTTILAARVVASVAMLMLPMWQGAGAMELTVVGALVAGGVSAPAAIAAIVLYRVAQFWFPLAMGGFVFLPMSQVAWWSPWERRAGLAGLASVAAVAVAAVVIIA